MEGVNGLTNPPDFEGFNFLPRCIQRILCIQDIGIIASRSVFSEIYKTHCLEKFRERQHYEKTVVLYYAPFLISVH